MKIFHEKRVNGLDHLRKVLGPDLGDAIFRGHSSAGEAGLITGLELACQVVNGNTDLLNARELERALIREFKRRAHHYLPLLPAHEQQLEWLALMQHHGAPTRLLDWTYSPHVALHFAIAHSARTKNADPIVWMMNAKWCRHASEAATGQTLRDATSDLEAEQLTGQVLMWPHLASSVWPVNPFRLNERLTIQKGVFLAPGDVTKTFVENLVALPGHQDGRNITKFVLPRKSVADMLRELYVANITDATLFPGLDGFARSLWTSARFLDLRPFRIG